MNPIICASRVEKVTCGGRNQISGPYGGSRKVYERVFWGELIFCLDIFLQLMEWYTSDLSFHYIYIISLLKFFIYNK